LFALPIARSRQRRLRQLQQLLLRLKLLQQLLQRQRNRLEKRMAKNRYAGVQRDVRAMQTLHCSIVKHLVAVSS
jgi:hypothetical protein